MFRANLNVFIPSFVLIAIPGGAALSAAIAFVLPEVDAEFCVALACLVIFAALGGFWMRKGLVPADRDQASESRYRNGHRLLAITTVLVAISIVIPLLLAKRLVMPETGPLGWLAIPAIAIALFTWPTGLRMIWSSQKAAA